MYRSMKRLVAGAVATGIVISAMTAGIAFSPTTAMAADKVRLVISTRMPWELFAPEQAQAEGFFKEEDLDVSIIYASGGAETIQAIATGSQDIAVGVGTLSAITAFAKGSPITMLANGRRGTGEVFWYVPKDSPIKSLKDLEGKELVFSRPGSTTHTIAQFLLRESGIDAKLVSVGGIGAARTQAMSGQVPNGWSAAPVMLDQVRMGNIRMIATGDDAKALASWSIRASVANSDWLAENRDVATRFMRAHWKGIKFMYEGGEPALKRYAEKWDLNLDDVKRAPEFTPLKDVTYTPVNIDELIQLAVDQKMISEPLTEEQKAKFVDVVYDPDKQQ